MPELGPAGATPASTGSAPGPVRDAVIDAVDDLVRGRGWAATTMSDVAAAAGVSRQTVYNEFGSRRLLVEAYVGREVEALVSAASDAVRRHADDPHAALRAAFALFLQLASDEPVVQIIVADTSSDGELMQLLTGVGQQLAGGRIAQLIPEVWPQVGTDDARPLAESLVRLAISHALLPSGEPAAVAHDVGRIFAPFVDAVLGG